MFLLGLIGFFQIVLLPGAITLLSLRPRSGIINLLISAFCLSLALNHLLVLLLVATHLYTPVVMRSLVLSEIIILFGLVFRNGDYLTSSVYSDFMLLNEWHRSMWRDNEQSPILSLMLYYSVLTIIIYISYCFVSSIGGIFTRYDAIVSWNRWAVEWSTGRVPLGMYHYPQLLPTNLSIPYLLMNDRHIQFFSRAVMPLFILVILLMQLDLWLKSREKMYLIAIPITTYLLIVMNNMLFILDGYADLLVSCMGFASIYKLLCNYYEHHDDKVQQNVLIALFIATSAAFAKQSGVYIFVIMVCFVILRYASIGMHRLESVQYKKLIMCTILCVGVVLVYYAWMDYLSKMITSTNEIEMCLINPHSGRGAFGRFIHAIELINESISNLEIYNTLQKYLIGNAMNYAGISLFGIVFAGVLLSLADRHYRWIAMYIALPFSAIWLFLFSYDTRNFSMAAPFLGIASGCGFLRILRPSKRAILVTMTVFLVLLLATLNVLITPERMKNRQIVLQRQIGSSEINDWLYKYASFNNSLKIISTYGTIKYLPGFENKWSYFNKDESKFTDSINSKENGYVMIHTPNTMHPLQISLANKLTAKGMLKVTYSGPELIFYEIVRQGGRGD